MLDFSAGQYIDILLDDGQRRAFSFANRPHASSQIELHIRLVPGGRFTTHVFEAMRVGDVLRFDAERLRILVERHHLHTGSARARALLEDWENALQSFVKVMPRDYKRALLQARERATAKAVAAE